MATAPQEREVDLVGSPASTVRLGKGLLIKPRGARALYVLAHGAGAGVRHPFMAAIARALPKHAIPPLRWEFPYMAAGKARPDGPAVAEAAVREAWHASAAYARGLPRFA